jgi:hypothetical protein
MPSHSQIYDGIKKQTLPPLDTLKPVKLTRQSGVDSQFKNDICSDRGKYLLILENIIKLFRINI